MEEHAIVYQQTYKEFKAELDHEINKVSNGFVRIGYLLKQARDTDILKESQYSSYTEFAREEYHLEESQVSRFIGIAERFTKPDKPEELKDEFKDYGVAKLGIMLTLPDEVNEELSPDMSKAEIAAVAEEIHEEEKITPIERMTEEVSERSFLEEVLYQIGAADENASMMVDVFQLVNFTINPDYKKLPGIFAPAGNKLYVVRVAGKGRVMFNVQGRNFTATAPMDGTKEEFNAEAVGKAIESICDREYYDKDEEVQEKVDDGRKLWAIVYGRDFPEIAPVQKKESKVSVAKAEAKKAQNDKKAAKNTEKAEKITQKTEKVTEEPMNEPAEEESGEPAAEEKKRRYTGGLMPSQLMQVIVDEYERRRNGEGTVVKILISEAMAEAMKEAVKALKEVNR